MSADPAISARLCASCGMCCDGVLFHAVNLQKGDSPRQLSAIGMKLRRKKGIDFFLQPCSFHNVADGSCSCAIYDQRPMRCRNFNCKQMEQVTTGDITEVEAGEKIRTARAHAAEVNDLINQLGESNLNRSLAQRVAHALTLQKGEERTPLHDRLDGAMIELEALLDKEFRVPA